MDSNGYCVLENCGDAPSWRSQHGLCRLHERDRAFGVLSAEDERRVWERSAHRDALQAHDTDYLRRVAAHSAWIVTHINGGAA